VSIEDRLKDLPFHQRWDERWRLVEEYRYSGPSPARGVVADAWIARFQTPPEIEASFALLELDITADVEDITKAFRTKALLHHPDVGGDAEIFKDLLDAKNRCMLYRRRVP